jgi:hypothetical protein
MGNRYRFRMTASGGVSAPSVVRSNFDNTAGATSLTISLDCTGANFLYVCFGVFGVPTISSVKYAGVTMTQDTNQSIVGVATIFGYFLANPTSGVNNIVITLTSSLQIQGGGVAFTGVNTSSPLRTAVGANDGVGSSPASTGSITSSSTEICLGYGYAGGALTVGGGQTELWNQADTGVSDDASTKAGAASVTQTWTVAGSQPWVCFQNSVKA